MPRLSYPKGRTAAALKMDLKSGSVKLTDAEPLFENVDEIDVEAPADQIIAPTEQSTMVEDPSEALKAQIETLRKSERDAIARAEVAERRATEEASRRETEVTKSQEQIVNEQVNTINASLAAATAEAESAQRDIEAALAMQDGKAQADAYRRLSRAEARILTFEQGKDALERQIKEIKEAPKPVKAQAEDDALARSGLPPRAQKWLREHSEYLYDARKSAKLQALHWDVVDEGIAPYSEEYFEAVEERLAPPTRKPVVEAEVEDEPIQSTKRIYSAPPSREVPSSSGQRNQGKITLTPSQKEAAKIAGITEAEYAKQALELARRKSIGDYTGGQ